jgi:hypothetical protein
MDNDHKPNCRRAVGSPGRRVSRMAEATFDKDGDDLICDYECRKRDLGKVNCFTHGRRNSSYSFDTADSTRWEGTDVSSARATATLGCLLVVISESSL